MPEKINLLIVNDGERKTEMLRVEAEKLGIGIHIVGKCESINQAEGAVHLYKPDIIVVCVDSVNCGLSFAEKLARDGFDGVLCFYGECVELEIICSAMSRGGYVFLDSSADSSRIAEKIKLAVGLIKRHKKMRNAVDSIFLGAPQITEAYFSKLLAGEDSEYLRLQLGVMDINLPSSGCVVYGKTLNPLNADHAERCYNALETLTHKAIGDYWRDCFVLVTANRDAYAIKNSAKPIIAELSASGGEFVVGISEFSADVRSMKDAVKTAKSLVSDNMFLSVCGVYTDNDNVVINSNKCRRLVNDAIKLICEHYAEKISAEWAAKQLFVSASHLMHEFKKSLGFTFNDCLKRYRIMRAKELLSSGNYRVNEVAHAVGFPDARYFGMVFKDETGISPGEFIKLVNAEE